MSAFRALNTPRKIVIGLLAGGAGYATVNYVIWPFNRELYMTNTQQNEIDAFTVKRIEEVCKNFQNAENCNSLLKKHLTKDVVDQLKYRKTRLGATLYDVIRSGVNNLDASVGVYAPDAESYKTFAPLFDKIIEDYHGFSPKESQPAVDLGEGKAGDFPELDPKNKYILSTRIRCGRSLAGYPFNPLLTEDDYLIMEQKVKTALDMVQDKELKGVYYPLAGMTKQTQNQLISDHFLFKEGDRHLK
uniref:arginine kinase n=1 Tax=Plectus sambesii TaxID=2011161 RepID=A0A914XLF5_9BILA